MSIHRKTYPDTRRYTAIVKEIAQNKYNRSEAEDRRVKAESEKTIIAKPLPEEMVYKNALIEIGRQSYFTEVFEGIPESKQILEVQGFIYPVRESHFYIIGRQNAEKLVKTGVATIENYGDFCVVEASKKHR